MRVDGLRIERNEYRSKIVFYCNGSLAEIAFYSYDDKKRHESFDPAVKLLDYVDFLVRERVAIQEKYIATLDKYAALINERAIERERAMEVDIEKKPPESGSPPEAAGAALE